MKLEELEELYRAACEEVQARSKAWDDLAADASDEDVEAARGALKEATEVADKREKAIEEAKASAAAREKHKPEPLDPKEKKDGLPTNVDEPDLYAKGGRSFLADLYAAQLRADPAASERIRRHQEFEAEKRAVSTGTLGGIIPPQYLVDLYAKASRAGRGVRRPGERPELPEVGMSLIIPRLTTGTAAGVQAAEGDVVATQDPVEDDLTVYVRTIAGYIPVSRQTLERAAYSEAILFEDLLARYWSVLDSQSLTGSGAAGQILGIFNTEGVVSVSANSSPTIETLWNSIADALQQILTKWGGLGIQPAKIFMHPRRWGQITAYLDDEGRPLFGYNNMPPVTVALLGDGSNKQYGLVGMLQGLPVYTDANMPIDLGSNIDHDAIVITLTRPGAPCSFWGAQRRPGHARVRAAGAGTSLQVQLIAYGYAAFTAGRYPDASAIIDDFPPPTF